MHRQIRAFPTIGSHCFGQFNAEFVHAPRAANRQRIPSSVVPPPAVLEHPNRFLATTIPEAESSQR